jgi:hypothetical protein
MRRAILFTLFAAAAASLSLTGACGGSSWSTPLAALDRVPLSVTQPGGATVFAVGGALGSGGDALFLRYDGAAWTRVATNTTATLWWVHAFSATDAYAVGEQGTIVRYAAGALTPETTPTTRTLYGVWGASADDVWAVGGQPDIDGVVLRKDATGWHTVTTPGVTGAYFKVWGSSANDVFICGQGGAVLHWDGAQLTAQPTGLASNVTLFTIAGRAPNDVYAVGGLGSAVALHYDGSAWSPVADPALAHAPGLAGVAVDADGAVVMSGANGTLLRGRAGALADESRAATTDDLHATSIRAGEVFAVGGNYFAPAPAVRRGVVVHFGGAVASTIK